MAESSEQATVDESLVVPATSLRNLSGFRFFWISRTISGLGSAMSMVALPVLAYQVTKSPVVVSLVAAAETIPYVLFGLIAGVVADRFDRRLLMTLSDLVCAFSMASIVLASALGFLTPWHIVAAALLSSSGALFFEAGVYGLVPAVVGKENIARANSLLYGSSTAVRIAGTAAAGALIAAVQPAGTIALDAVTFLASAFFIRGIGPRAPQSSRPAAKWPGYRKSIKEGLRFLWGLPTLRTMTVVGTLQSISGGAIVGQLVVFAGSGLGLHDSDPRIGLLYTAWSAGGIGGSLVLPRVRRRIGAFQLLLVALPLGSLLGLLVVMTTDWRIALVAITLWGTVYLMVLVNTMNYSQEVTPPEMQSRVNTTRRTFSSGLGVPLGALLSSTVTTHFSIRAGMFTAVVSVAAAALLVWAVQIKRTVAPTPS
ncbi:MFS transporter [Streptomyces inhibens]|uniref:MFS transporter n=1 Tax=Streptomyces inhibens TaxID=2293571 RepID=A0A371Q9P3_STRIH|nr:MFS transporter [Streptomyces inhibens]REK91163.1 MFS transporter [Streptomyces inhibens]